MFLTSKETIGYILLVLPDTTKALLYSQRITEFANLLKLIYTYNKMNALLLSYQFRQLENFLGLIVLWGYAKREIFLT